MLNYINLAYQFLENGNVDLITGKSSSLFGSLYYLSITLLFNVTFLHKTIHTVGFDE